MPNLELRENMRKNWEYLKEKLVKWFFEKNEKKIRGRILNKWFTAVIISDYNQFHV